MKFLILVVSLVAIIASQKLDRTNNPNWKAHVSKHSLKFNNVQEETNAYNNYMTNDALIQKHNSNPIYKYKVGHNAFSHWSPEDHKKHKGGLVKSRSKRDTIINNHTHITYFSTPGFVAPASVDWVKAGFNKPVRDQRTCGDCWAFGSVAALEAALWFKNKTNVTLSPQQLTDCSFSYGNFGCNGGFQDDAYAYINDNGIVEDQYYPFTSNNGTCKYSSVSSKPLYRVSSYYKVHSGTDDTIMEALSKFGPIAVQIATSWTYSFYRQGLYADDIVTCNDTITDHVVLLTGYGTDTNGSKYWTIKNQWGAGWGQGGYMNLSRNYPNTCGIQTAPVFPVV